MYFSPDKCSGPLKALIMACQQDHSGFCFVRYRPERLEHLMQKEKKLNSPLSSLFGTTTEEEMQTLILALP